VNSSPTDHVRVLFVDDEPAILETCPAILRKHDFNVTSVGTVADALAEIKSAQFNVLISDMNIGEPGDGFLVVKAMRKAHPNCVTLVLTGHPVAETALLAFRYQVDDGIVDGIVSKGEGPETLLARVDSLIARKAGRASTKQPPSSKS
jgi:DNA-binding NtrC family response regulator